MNVLGLVAGRPATSDEGADPVVRTVWPTTDLVVDGVGLRGLLDPDGAYTEHVFVFDAWQAWDADAAMRHGAFPEAFWPAERRIPVLMLRAGELEDGVFTCRFTDAGGVVTWDEWAFDDFTSPQRPLPNVPAYRFARQEYDAAVDQLLAQATNASGPLTTLEGPQPRRGLFGRAVKRRTSEADEALYWLDARAVRPSLADPGDASATYLDFLEDLELCQADFAAAGLHVPLAARPETLDRLRRILQSPHSISLPTKTLWAVRRLADHLAASGRD